MIIVHHLQRQFAATKFPGLAFASLQLNLIEICFCPLTPDFPGSPQRVRPVADADEKETKLDAAFHATVK